MDQSRMPLGDALAEYISSSRVSMHIPGHKKNCMNTIPELEAMIGSRAIACDITEIEGFDDYHEPEGIIKEAMQLAAELFGADETYFLVNGTTAGIMAAVASAASEGESVLIASDCHKSVTRGLILSGADPVYISPFIDPDTGLPAGIDISQMEKILSYGGIRAVVLSNPSYYGTYSDIAAIAELAHKHNAAVIVDEAHGAHLRFTEQEILHDAMSAGADIAVQSTHKMLGSLTQSSMLHVKGEMIDRKRLAYNIRLLTSTSPSYLLMASLDAVRHRMAADGKQIWKNISEITLKYSEKINNIKGINCVRNFTDARGIKKPLDCGRLLISAAELGISGYELSDMLCNEYNIDMELADDIYALAVMGSATDISQLEELLSALENISAGAVASQRQGCGLHKVECNNKYINGMSAAAAAADINHISDISPRKAVFSRHDLIEAEYAAGRISAEEIAVYPPGIPFVVPGEKFTDRTIDIITELVGRGVHVHGVELREEEGKTKIMLSVAEDEMQAMLFKCIF